MGSTHKECKRKASFTTYNYLIPTWFVWVAHEHGATSGVAGCAVLPGRPCLTTHVSCLALSPAAWTGWSQVSAHSVPDRPDPAGSSRRDCTARTPCPLHRCKHRNSCRKLNSYSKLTQTEQQQSSDNHVNHLLHTHTVTHTASPKPNDGSKWPFVTKLSFPQVCRPVTTIARVLNTELISNHLSNVNNKPQKDRPEKKQFEHPINLR